MKKEVVRKVLQDLFIKQKTLYIAEPGYLMKLRPMKPSEYMQLAIELEEHVDELPEVMTWKQFSDMSDSNKDKAVMSVFWGLMLKESAGREW